MEAHQGLHELLDITKSLIGKMPVADGFPIWRELSRLRTLADGHAPSCAISGSRCCSCACEHSREIRQIIEQRIPVATSPALETAAVGAP